MTEPTELVEVELGRIVLRDHSPVAPQYIYLRERGGERSFPIVIGLGEALELQRVVTGVRTERPMTHELLLRTIESLGARLDAVEIVDLRDNTFFARIRLVNEAGEVATELDARPSDSIALATRARCPLRVCEAVLAEAMLGHDLPSPPGAEGDPEPEPEPGSEPGPDEAPDF